MAHPLEKLSPREREIVACVKEGLTTPEIAQRLFVSVSTVGAHMANIQRKLDPRCAS